MTVHEIVGENERSGFSRFGPALVINGCQRSQEEAADVSEYRGTSRGDAVRGEELVEFSEGQVDALSGLEVLRFPEKPLGKVGGFILPGAGAVMGAEGGLGIVSKQAALAAGRGAMGATI